VDATRHASVAVIGFALGACCCPPSPACAPAPDAIAAVPTEPRLAAKSSDGALWAFRRWTDTGVGSGKPVGPMILMRTSDRAVLARLAVPGEILGFGAPIEYLGVRFCDDGRFGLLTREGTTTRASVWDRAGEEARPIDLGDTSYEPYGWSRTCEIIALSRSESRYRPGAKEYVDDPEETRVTIRLLRDGSRQDFPIVAIKHRAIDVVDVTDDAVLVLTSTSHIAPGDAPSASNTWRRLMLVDRASGRTRIVANRPAAWIRRTSRSWLVVFESEPPRMVGLDERGAPKHATNSRMDADMGFSVAALDADGETVAVVEDGRLRWWSVSSGRLLGVRVLEPFDGLDWWPARLTFSRDGRLMAASDDVGNVVAVRRDGRVAYRRAFGISSCGPGIEMCASGNMEPLMKSLRTADGEYFAVGTRFHADEHEPGVSASYRRWAHKWTRKLETSGLSAQTTLVDLATGELDVLPTHGEPLGFLHDGAELAIGEDVFSTYGGDIVGQLPH
jgi:hypothetical protein